jgi:putative peptide zinc metalloprotease protein
VASSVPAPDKVTICAGSKVRLVPLSVVRESEDSYIIGSGSVGTFLRVPAVAAAVIAGLQQTLSVRDTAAQVRQARGEDVDVADFVSALVAAGLVAGVDGVQLDRLKEDQRPAWLGRLPSSVARIFFCRSAWVAYIALFTFSIVLMAFWPQFRPSYEDLFFYPDPAVCLAVSWIAAWLLTIYHELGHLVAARAAGLGARFTLGRRFWFVVFETDLSALWSCSRWQRIQAFLAGVAFDSLLLGICLALRLTWVMGLIDFHPALFRVLGLIVALQTFSLGWQLFLVFRTDLYAVLATILGCSNLYRVKDLLLKRNFGVLKPAEMAELSAAHPRDVQIGRWFGWAYLAAILWASYFLINFFVPATVVVIGWVVSGLSSSPPTSSVFWEAFTLVAVAACQAALPAVVLIRDGIRSRRRGVA